MYEIRNEELTVTMARHGAEMKSVKDNRTGEEYLWCGNPEYWKRTSPVLFPLVGNYKNKETIYKGKRYQMTQHGFARDMDFEPESAEEDEIWFVLSDTEETKKSYPFSFRLHVGYRLSGRTVTVLWKVENTNEEEMYFSIGGHPAFNCPTGGKGKQTDYRIRFDTEKTLISSVIGEGGLLNGEKAAYPLENREMPVTEDLFAKDALVIEGNQAQEASLIDPEGRAYVTVAFDAPLFGIWAPKGGKAPFICIEPWYGRCDRADFDQELCRREWGNVLEAGAVFEKSYQITFR